MIDPKDAQIASLKAQVDRFRRKSEYLEGKWAEAMKSDPMHIAAYEARLDEANSMLRRWAGGNEQGLVWLAIRLAVFRKKQKVANYFRKRRQLREFKAKRAIV